MLQSEKVLPFGDQGFIWEQGGTISQGITSQNIGIHLHFNLNQLCQAFLRQIMSQVNDGSFLDDKGGDRKQN